MSKRFTLALAVGAASTLAAADPVTFWNTVAGKALTPTQSTNPVGQSRTYAILHASIHDALNAIDARYASYTPGLPQDPGASAVAAVAATSRSVLTTLIPDQADLIGTAYAKELAAIAGRSGQDSGHRARRSSRAIDSAAAAAGRRGPLCRSCVRPSYRSRGVSIHRTLQLRSVPGVGQRDTIRHCSQGT